MAKENSPTLNTLIRTEEVRRSYLPPGLEPIGNVHGVPAKNWNKWSEPARRRFNQMFELMIDHPKSFQNPRYPESPAPAWRTTAWVASFISACMEVSK